MSSPTPTATGSLGSTPLLNLLVYALDHQLTGTLVLEEPDGLKHAIYFELGAPAKIRTATPVAFLGEVLVQLGDLSEEQRSITLSQAQRSNKLHGEVLLSNGDIEEATLREGLREQLLRKVMHLIALPPETVFGYYAHTNFLEQWGGREHVRGKPLALIWRLVETQARAEHVDEVLTRLGERYLRLHHDAPVLRFRFARAERSVIEVLRAKPQPLAELLARDLAEPLRVRRLIYALAITRQLDLGVPGVEPLGVDEAPSSSRIPVSPTFTPPGGTSAVTGAASAAQASQASIPPPVYDPEVLTFRAEIALRAERVDEGLYEVLGLSREAEAADIQTAFIALARKWHPDRLGPDFRDLKEQANRVFARMSEAQQVLCDPVQRREYDQRVRIAGKEAQEQEHVQRVLRAATAFQKAEVHLKRNNLAAAEAEATQALADDPDQAEYQAFVAWIMAQKPNAQLEELIKVLDRAVGMQPNNVRARWYRGQLYKRIGKENRAVQDFKFIVERDPRHLDAQREVRLYQMRRSGSRPPSAPPAANLRSSVPPLPEKAKTSESGGLISKLFKR
ncbi:MAG TPA: J domain-containing protein [Polyangiaceae bacterium]|nr:J domain-containing protein [Polyangiaceae bacterium]